MSLSDHVVVFDRGRPICEGTAVGRAERPPSPGGLPWRLTPRPSHLLELADIEAGYGRAALVLRGLTVKVPPATVVCLVGPNGAGKSTVLKVASGMLTPALGHHPRRRAGRHRSSSPQQMLAAGLSHVLQGHSVFREMTVAENVLLGAYTLQGQGASVDDRVDFVKTLFPVVAERWTALAGAAVRRPAEAGGVRPLADGQPAGRAARRAVHGPGPQGHRHRLRAGRADARRRHRGAARRAERPPGPARPPTSAASSTSAGCTSPARPTSCSPTPSWPSSTSAVDPSTAPPPT